MERRMARNGAGGRTRHAQRSVELLAWLFCAAGILWMAPVAAQQRAAVPEFSTNRDTAWFPVGDEFLPPAQRAGPDHVRQALSLRRQWRRPQGPHATDLPHCGPQQSYLAAVGQGADAEGQRRGAGRQDSVSSP